MNYRDRIEVGAIPAFIDHGVRIWWEHIVMHERPDFPTMKQVEKADREQLARWYSHLLAGETPEQKKIMDRINQRFKKLGGMTPELERKIGY